MQSSNVQVFFEDDGGRLRVEALDARVGRRGHIRMRGQLPLQPPPRRCFTTCGRCPPMPPVAGDALLLMYATGGPLSSDSFACSCSACARDFCRQLQQPANAEPAAISVDVHNLELRARNLYTGMFLFWVYKCAHTLN